jgi:hypothetical protein
MSTRRLEGISSFKSYWLAGWLAQMSEGVWAREIHTDETGGRKGRRIRKKVRKRVERKRGQNWMITLESPKE